MNNFLPIKRNHRAAPLRLAARIISIMILAFLWPVRGGAQTQTTDLDVSDSKITAKLALTYKQIHKTMLGITRWAKATKPSSPVR